MKVRVKICGITRVEDALAAIAAGADMIGLNFYAKTPRFVDVDRAREIREASWRARHGGRSVRERESRIYR